MEFPVLPSVKEVTMNRYLEAKWYDTEQTSCLCSRVGRGGGGVGKLNYLVAVRFPNRYWVAQPGTTR